MGTGTSLKKALRGPQVHRPGGAGAAHADDQAPHKEHSEMTLSPRAGSTEDRIPRDAGQCFFPPISCSVALRVGREGAVLTSTQQRKLQTKGLLAELARIEQELRETVQREEEKQRELDQMRQEENQERWRSLCFLTLNQRTAKPWVTSYYRNIPMHIYCLPIETDRQKMKRKKEVVMKRAGQP